MGCCSGNEDSSTKGSQHSGGNPHSITTTNYMYFPGASKHTDYTKSQVRTGWASEVDRKRHIMQTNYYKPSYVVLADHGDGKSISQSGTSTFSTLLSSNRKRGEENATRNSDKVGHSEQMQYSNENSDAIFRRKFPNKKNNYFGTYPK